MKTDVLFALNRAVMFLKIRLVQNQMLGVYTVFTLCKSK